MLIEVLGRIGTHPATLSHLAGAKIVFLRQASEPDIRSRFRKRCLEAGFEPNVVVEVDQLEVLLAFVAAGVGVSCVPSLVSRLPFPGVTIRRLSGGVEGGISMVWNPARLTPTARQFLTIMRSERDAPEVAKASVTCLGKSTRRLATAARSGWRRRARGYSARPFDAG